MRKESKTLPAMQTLQSITSITLLSLSKHIRAYIGPVTAVHWPHLAICSGFTLVLHSVITRAVTPGSAQGTRRYLGIESGLAMSIKYPNCCTPTPKTNSLIPVLSVQPFVIYLEVSISTEVLSAPHFQNASLNMDIFLHDHNAKQSLKKSTRMLYNYLILYPQLIFQNYNKSAF